MQRSPEDCKEVPREVEEIMSGGSDADTMFRWWNTPQPGFQGQTWAEFYAKEPQKALGLVSAGQFLRYIL